MVVKDKRGRRRYVIFRVEGGPIDGRHLSQVLRREFEKGHEPKLIQFDGRLGIVRCPHDKRREVTERLNRISQEGLRIVTLRSSGTLKSLRERYPINTI